MALKDDIKSARQAVDKLQAYCKGLPKGSVPTRKYQELNGAADRAIRKLPSQYRSQLAMDLSRIFIK